MVAGILFIGGEAGPEVGGASLAGGFTAGAVGPMVDPGMGAAPVVPIPLLSGCAVEAPGPMGDIGAGAALGVVVAEASVLAPVGAAVLLATIWARLAGEAFM